MRAILAVLLLLVAWPALAVDHNGTSANLGWTPSSGAPVGYEVWVKRNAAASVREQDVTSQFATIAGVAGETVIVKVRAYTTAKATFSAFSPDSDPVTFRPVPGVPGKPTWIELLVQWLRSFWSRFA